MGQYFKIVNPAKREYLDIGNFASENPKANGVLHGYHAFAVAILVCNLSEVRHDFGELAGSWYGDPVIVAGDDHGAPDLYGIPTSTPEWPERNLNGMAGEEYRDITHLAIAMICQGSKEWTRELAERAKRHPPALVDLGRTVFELGCPPLEAALVEHVGADWTKLYKQARGRQPG